MLAAPHCVRGQELPPFGQLPDSGMDWKLREKGEYGDAPFQWHWVILTNAESGDVTNRLAHGYEVVFDDTAVYIQHTSTKPITPEFVYARAVSLLSANSRGKSGAKLEPSTTPKVTR